MLEIVARAIAAAGLRPSDRLVVGLSGGTDSLALTRALLLLERSGSGPRVFPVHVDHQLRPDSAEAAQRVAALGDRLGRAVQTVVVDCGVWDSVLGQGVEGSARAARYAALTGSALELGTRWVAVAHNADDQAEGVLLALCRGASSAGLAGMQGCSSREIALEPDGARRVFISLIRPLLEVRRSVIADFLRSECLEPIEDPSNDCTRFQRNALRHTVLPSLEAVFPGAVNAIRRSADQLSADSAFLELLARQAGDEIGLRSIDGCRLIPREGFKQLPSVLQRRLLWSVLREVNASGRRIKQERIESALSIIAGSEDGRLIEIVDELVLYLDSEVVAIGPRDALFTPLRRDSGLPLLTPWAAFDLGAGRHIFEVGGDQRLVVDVLPGGRQVRRRRQLRTRRPGDRLGPSTGQRLQDLLVDRRVPRAVRDWLPLVASDSSVEWVGGLSPSTYRSDDESISLVLG